MEAPMKLLVSAVAVAVALAWPVPGEAQSATSKAKRAQTTQKHVPRRAKVARTAAARPCAARTWAGCQGWDPDANVRTMIQMDAGRDDQP
jgi:hypothetical protein